MKRVALCIETSRAYGRDILRGVRDYLSSQSQEWSTTLELRDLQSATPGWLGTWSGDGILTRTDSPAMARTIKRLRIPTIELRSQRLMTHVPFVGMDNEQIGKMAADHLIGLGLKRFATYAIDVEEFFTVRRHSFVDAIEKAGYPCEIYAPKGSREKPARWNAEQRALSKWLRGLEKPIGILASTDQLGCWLLEACRSSGILVPDEVAVLGVENDDTLCDFSNPPLSSVRLDGHRVGLEAAKQLQQLMSGRPASADQTLIRPAGVAIRQSSDWIGVDDSLVSSALRLIRTGEVDSLTVDRLATQLDCSRSTLERRFRDRLGRTPNDELIRSRLERARRLLEESDASVEVIARQCGVGGASYLTHQFKRLFGETPGKYRSRVRR